MNYIRFFWFPFFFLTKEKTKSFWKHIRSQWQSNRKCWHSEISFWGSFYVLVFRIYSTHVDKPGGKEHRWCPLFWLKNRISLIWKDQWLNIFFITRILVFFSNCYLALLLLIRTTSGIFTFIQGLFSQKVPVPGHQNHFPNHGDAALIFICDLWCSTANKETNPMNTKAFCAIPFALVRKIFSLKLWYK